MLEQAIADAAQPVKLARINVVKSRIARPPLGPSLERQRLPHPAQIPLCAQYSISSCLWRRARCRFMVPILSETKGQTDAT